MRLTNIQQHLSNGLRQRKIQELWGEVVVEAETQMTTMIYRWWRCVCECECVCVSVCVSVCVMIYRVCV